MPKSQQAAEPVVSALTGFDPSREDRRDWWCWIADDPEYTYPDVEEFASDIFPGDAPLIQRFDWGRPAPSTWLLVYYDGEDGDGERVVREFGSESEARSALASAIEARRAETAETGSVGDESATAESRDAQP